MTFRFLVESKMEVWFGVEFAGDCVAVLVVTEAVGLWVDGSCDGSFLWAFLR